MARGIEWSRDQWRHVTGCGRAALRAPGGVGGLWRPFYCFFGVLLAGKSCCKNPTVVPRLPSQNQRRNDGMLRSLILINGSCQSTCRPPIVATAKIILAIDGKKLSESSNLCQAAILKLRPWDCQMLADITSGRFLVRLLWPWPLKS